MGMRGKNTTNLEPKRWWVCITSKEWMCDSNSSQFSMKVEQNLDYSGLSSLITDSNEETLLLRSLDAYCFIEF